MSLLRRIHEHKTDLEQGNSAICFADEALAFVAEIDREIEAARELADLYAGLEESIATGPERAYLDRSLKDLDQVRSTATELLRVFEQGSLSKASEIVSSSEFLGERVLPLVLLDAERRWRDLKVMGRYCPDENPVITPAGKSREEVLYELVTAMNQATSYPRGSEDLPVWRYIGDDGQLWVYLHDEECKWLCVFVRVEVTAVLDRQRIATEWYIPFGLDGDPGDYPLDERKAIQRKGWVSVDVQSYGLSRGRTFSLDRTQSSSVSTGRSSTSGVSDTQGIQHTRGTSNTKSQAFQSSLSQAFGQTTGSSESSTSGRGSGGYSSSFSDQVSRSYQNMRTQMSGWSESSSITHNASDAESHQSTISDSETRSHQETSGTSVRVGFQDSEGLSMQVSEMHYGIDYGQPNSVHVQKWMEGNPQVGRTFRLIRDVLKIACENLCTNRDNKDTSRSSAGARPPLQRLIVHTDLASGQKLTD